MSNGTAAFIGYIFGVVVACILWIMVISLGVFDCHVPAQEPTFAYGDQVFITKGFYKNQHGKAVQEPKWANDYHYGIEVKTASGIILIMIKEEALEEAAAIRWPQNE